MAGATLETDALPARVAEVEFRRLYAEHGRAVLAYALRRVRDPEDAADILAETFLTAWRRLPEVPAGEAARPWLYGVARRTLANQRRGEQRRTKLAERLRGEIAAGLGTAGDDGQATLPVREALGRLQPDDREILLLSGWEGLTPRQSAAALGISAVAARSRLHRARRRLRRELSELADRETTRNEEKAR